MEPIGLSTGSGFGVLSTRTVWGQDQLCGSKYACLRSPGAEHQWSLDALRKLLDCHHRTVRTTSHYLVANLEFNPPLHPASFQGPQGPAR